VIVLRVGDCVGDMTASSWLIRMKLGGSQDCTIVDGDKDPTAGLPSTTCRMLLASVGQQ
jgi:hypothetical protein